jgi:hypothetical protein
LPPETTAGQRPIITLDEYEVGWAVSVGHYRHHESEKRGLRQSDKSKDSNGLTNHKQGAAGELALSKFLEIAWQAPVNTYNNFFDLDGYVECRSKPDKQNYLRVYPGRDSRKGSSVFVSVAKLANDLTRFRIEGWIMGKAAMQAAYSGTSYNINQKEWQVPLSALQPPATLLKEMNERLAVVKKAAKECGAGSGEQWNRRGWHKATKKPIHSLQRLRVARNDLVLKTLRPAVGEMIFTHTSSEAIYLALTTAPLLMDGSTRAFAVAAAS